MKIQLILALAILFTYTCGMNISLSTHKNTSDSHSASHSDLYYYHKWEQGQMNQPKKNVPLREHYRRERIIRRKTYMLDDQIASLKRKGEMRVRDLKHEKLRYSNRLNQEKSIRKAETKLHEQREAAIKEEINHDEKFREKYEERLVNNKARIESALPDQRSEFEKLVEFDDKRIKHFESQLDDEQKKLRDTETDDDKEQVHLIRTIGKLETVIAQLDSKIAAIQTQVKLRTSMMDSKAGHMHKMLESSGDVDKAKVETEHLENKIANKMTAKKEEILGHETAQDDMQKSGGKKDLA